jgi:putative endonuclease
MYVVYVILNAARVAYTGIAKNVTERLAQHDGAAPGGAKATRGRGPWRVIHAEGPMDKRAAMKREAAIKKDRTFKAELKSRTARASR